MPPASAANPDATTMRAWTVTLAITGILVAGSAATGQEQPQVRPQTRPDPQPATRSTTRPPPTSQPARRDEGKTVRHIRVERNKHTSAEQILQLMRTRVGAPLKANEIQEDLKVLWRERRIRVLQVQTEDAEGGIDVILVVEENPNFQQVEWRGLDHFTESEVKTLLDIASTPGMNRLAAENYAKALEDRYRRDGFHSVKVRIEEDDKASKLTFFVDEGKRVRIRSVNFRGNFTFPGEPFLVNSLSSETSLVSGAKLQSKTQLIGPNEVYSERAVEADVERLRLFYRAKGFRDAIVEQDPPTWNEEHDGVDLTFRILEGRRYKIVSLDLVQEPAQGRDKPIYPKEEVLAVTKVKPGEFYDRDKIDRDMLAIEEFYGKRGHPSKLRWGAGLTQPFDRRPPTEVFDVEKAEVRLVYELSEGTPKRLHDVVIHGNVNTKDRVIRRKVLVIPGEMLDFNKVDRSQQLLDELGYFFDDRKLAGVRFDLQRVENDPDAVDLAVDVTEGQTGQFLWGAGISTGLGFVGRIELLKKNFDITQLPSSPDPITVASELIDGRAFSGGGQTLDLVFAPGTKITTGAIKFYEPDIFQRHQDTIGLRVNGTRRIQGFESYRTDELGLVVGLDRAFTEDFLVSVNVRESNVQVEDLTPNAPEIVQDAKGSTELRSLQLGMRYRSLDHVLIPTKGFEGSFAGELFGFGAEANLWKTGLEAAWYWPVLTDDRLRSHVVKLRGRFDYAKAYAGDTTVFLTERYFMGAHDLRGFDYRGAGPTQFGQPIGGEARVLAGVEYGFPILSTPNEGRLRENEILRGHFFSDFGLLGLAIDDATFREPRLTVGVGVRIRLPFLGGPGIELDLGYPVLYEETDDRHPFFFTIAR